MARTTARLRDQIAALAALQYEHAQILDGRVMNPAAAAVIMQAVQAHVRALAACLPRTTPARVQPADVDPVAMTDAELYAYYKRTAPAEDLRFFLRGRLSDALRRRAEAITKPTARDLISLREAWRIERQAHDRAAGIPAIGTAEWHRQCASQASADADVLAVDADAEHRPTADAQAETCGVSS
ncbi:MAG: hypothetical protein FJW27_16320 [Acidimicrobiia bacterium]|nr:hypothetical protein [Acidimicrobiia bacterium]